MKKVIQLLAILLMATLSLPVMAQAFTAKQVNIENFGEVNLIKLRKKVLNVQNRVAPPDSVLRITQLGDSHTAADIFTGQLRQKLQQRFGGAGIGWISPINIYGQRNTQVYYKASDWLLTSSRSTPAKDYPLGGFTATPTAANAQLTINYNVEETPSLWNAKILVKQLKPDQPLTLVDGMNYQTTLDTGNNRDWRYINVYVMLPFTISAQSANSAKIGGIWLEKNGKPGVIVSPVALNGAKHSIWQQWRPKWVDDLANTKSDLIIIAYGTNESFETPFNRAKYKQLLVNSIKQIRKKMPNTAILLVAPPDVMVRNKIGRAGSCQAMQPPQLATIRATQKEVAKQQHTLYWDWSAAMGGNCAMRRWVEQGLANKDYVHLTASGYQQSADSLYNALMQLLNLPNG